MNESLSYATPNNVQPRPILAASVIGAMSLGLIGLAGCFLIGIGGMFDIWSFAPGQARIWTPGEITFVTVLYVCCGLCFFAAALLLVMAVRRLMKA